MLINSLCCCLRADDVLKKKVDLRPRFGLAFFIIAIVKTNPLQEDIITLGSGVSSHYIVLHPVSSRASRTSGLLVQFIHHSWLIGHRNI